MAIPPARIAPLSGYVPPVFETAVPHFAASWLDHVTTVFNRVSAVTSMVFHDPEYFKTDVRHGDFTVEVTKTGNPTFNIDLEQSMDGAVWWGADSYSDESINNESVTLPYVRFSLTSFTDGGSGTDTVTLRVA